MFFPKKGWRRPVKLPEGVWHINVPLSTRTGKLRIWSEKGKIDVDDWFLNSVAPLGANTGQVKQEPTKCRMHIKGHAGVN